MPKETLLELVRRLASLRLANPLELDKVVEQMGKPEPYRFLDELERRSILTSFQRNRVENNEKKGYYVGRFRLLYRISSGTFARVYRAMDPNSGQMVAIKVLRGRHTIDPEMVRGFQREGRLLEQLIHPNIARTVDVGTDPDTKQHYIAMEFVEGGNLREILKIRQRFAPREFTRFAIEMVEGLKYALGKGVTHRDIKPTNILISSEGTIKWVDFGLADVVENRARKLLGGAEQRTVDYAGLEKGSGAPKGDPRSDIYFLGAAFYLMLTGHPALLETKDRHERMLRDRFVHSAAARSTDMPAELAQIIDKMLQFDPSKRYQNYDELLTDLLAAQEGTLVVKTAPAAQPGDGADELSASTSAAGSNKPRVIVVHKSEQVQERLKTKLGERGYQVVITNDVERAVVLHGLQRAEALIIDLGTTGRFGVDRYRRLLRDTPVDARKCAVLFLADDVEAQWITSLNGDPFAIVKKPVTLGALWTALGRLVPA